MGLLTKAESLCSIQPLPKELTIVYSIQVASRSLASSTLSSSCHVDPGGSRRKVAQVQRVVGNNLFNEQQLAVVPEKVAAIEGHTVTRLQWSVEASHRPGGWSPHMHIFWLDEKLPHLRERSSNPRASRD